MRFSLTLPGAMCAREGSLWHAAPVCPSHSRAASARSLLAQVKRVTLERRLRHCHESYSLGFSPGGALLACGGKKLVSLYRLASPTVPNVVGPNGTPLDYGFEFPVCVLSGHEKWVSGVAFAGPSTVVTASDDGDLLVWSLAVGCDFTMGSLVADELEGEPDYRIIEEPTTRKIDLHEGGIRCMDLRGTRIATGSKDFTVAVTELRGDGSLVNLTRFENAHSNFVKGVMFRDENVVASCGNDRAIQISDTRIQSIEDLIYADEWMPSVLSFLIFTYIPFFFFGFFSSSSLPCLYFLFHWVGSSKKNKSINTKKTILPCS